MKLEIKNLTKAFGGVRAIDDVSLDFPSGSLSAVIGPNGAGKSTFFNLISGAFPANSGQVLLDGQDVVRLSRAERMHRGIGRAFQVASCFPTMTVTENLMAAVTAHIGQWGNLSRRFPPPGVRERAEEVMELVGLTQVPNVEAAILSHGDQKLLDIAIALALEPKVLLLDEPTAGMGPDERWRMIERVRGLWEQRKLTLVFIEHDMDIVFQVASTIRVLCYGRVLAEGTPDEIRNNPAVIEAYLGTEDTRHDRPPARRRSERLLRREPDPVRCRSRASGKRTLALLGRNGAGKSTTMKTLAGIVPAKGGRIFFAGRDITHAPPHARAQLGLAYVPEDRQVFPEHSVEDNLLIAAKNGPDGRRDWTLPRIWETFPLLTKLRSRAGGPPVRRRATTAGDRACPDGQSAGAVARRTERRTGPDRGRHHQQGIARTGSERRDHPAGRTEHAFLPADRRGGARHRQRKSGASPGHGWPCRKRGYPPALSCNVGRHVMHLLQLHRFPCTADARSMRVEIWRPRRLRPQGRCRTRDDDVWTHPGMTTYYRNKSGRVFSAMPWRFVDYWAMTHEADLGRYQLTEA